MRQVQLTGINEAKVKTNKKTIKPKTIITNIVTIIKTIHYRLDNK